LPTLHLHYPFKYIYYELENGGNVTILTRAASGPRVAPPERDRRDNKKVDGD
jgi:hypothetical protein